MNRADRLAALTLLLLPLVWLWPSTFGDRYFVPYDVNQFPPVSTTAAAEETAAARDGGNLDVTEVPVWFLPELELARDELGAGRAPTWNPHARAGAPLHAHGLIGLCYPPNWVALFADEPAARLGLVAWINLALGGLLAFGLLRQLGTGAAAAFVGAALFELSGPMAANSFFWMRLASYVWLPGVLWAMVRTAQADRLRAPLVFGLAGSFAMTWLAGFPPFAATTTVFAGLWLVWMVLCRAREQDLAAAARLAGALLLGLGLGACLSLPQVLPSLQFFPESARTPTPLWRDISAQAFEPYGLLTWLIPEAFGSPVDADRIPYANGAIQALLNTRTDGGKVAVPNYNYTEYALTVSSLGLVLACFGLLAGRGKHAWFARTAAALALGLGLFLPGLQLLFHLPVVQNVWPMRWPAAGTLFVAWLAALGFDQLRRAPPRAALTLGGVGVGVALLLWWCTGIPAARHAADPEWAVNALTGPYDTSREAVVNHIQGLPARADDRFALSFSRFAAAGARGAWWLGGVSALLVAYGLVRRRERDLLLGAAVAASIAQLAVNGADVTRGAAAPGSRDTAAHAFLREQAAALAEGGGFTIARATRAPTTPGQLPPGQLMIPGVRDLNFYSHADARGLQPLRRLLDTYWAALKLPPDVGAQIAGKGFLSATLPAALLHHPWFDLIGVRYVLTTEPGLDEIGLGAPVGPSLRGDGAFFVHERPSAMPRAFVVPQVFAMGDDEEVLTALTSLGMKPGLQAFVVRDDLPAPIAAAPPDAPPRAVRFVRDDPTHVELQVDAGAGRALVFTDTLLSGWSATVDGEAVDLVRCNHSQRLVTLPETACKVTFTYTAPGLKAGLSIAGAALVSMIATWWLLRRRDRRFAAQG